MRILPSPHITSEAGFTLFELIVTLVLTGIVFVGAMQAYNAMTAASYDLHIRIETNVQAQAIIQTRPEKTHKISRAEIRYLSYFSYRKSL